MPDALTVGSLFSGIGGLELGLERAGMVTRWQVERDDYCRRVLAKHWPDVARFEDVRDVGAHNLPPVDVVCGGFPCQDISSAGNKVGITGSRSGLWTEYARIIRELRPRYVVVENVADLLARGMGAVLGDLAAIGYDAEWHCIPAAAVGAPHLRNRVFIVAYPHADRRGQQVGPQLDGATDPCAADRHSRGRHAHRLGDEVADADGTRLAQRQDAERGRLQPAGHPAAVGAGWWAAEPAVGRVADGVPRRVDRLRALGNAVVPQVAEFIGRLIVAADAEARGECAA